MWSSTANYVNFNVLRDIFFSCAKAAVSGLLGQATKKNVSGHNGFEIGFLGNSSSLIKLRSTSALRVLFQLEGRMGEI